MVRVPYYPRKETLIIGEPLSTHCVIKVRSAMPNIDRDAAPAQRHFADDDVGPGWELVRAAPSRERRLDLSLTGFRQRGPDRLDMRPRPLPAVTVVVGLGADLLTVDAAGAQDEMRSGVGGLVPKSARIRGRNVECVELRMSPLTAYTLLGGAAGELDGRMLDLDDLWGREAEWLCERLAGQTSWDERFATVEAALAARLEAGPTPDREVRRVWAQLLASSGSTRVDRLAAECGWSHKRLWTRFTAQVGLTPKRAARLVRFDAAARRLAAGHHPAAVAVACGYTDQPHLHRDVREFAGCTPRQLAQAAISTSAS